MPEDSLYRDVIDMPCTVAVINGPESHSGMNALFALIAPHSRDNKFFSEVIVSGSHAESLAADRRGDADVAAVDCVTGGAIKVIACIEDPAVIRKILDHLDQQANCIPPLPQLARGPPLAP